MSLDDAEQQITIDWTVRVLRDTSHRKVLLCEERRNGVILTYMLMMMLFHYCQYCLIPFPDRDIQGQKVH